MKKQTGFLKLITIMSVVLVLVLTLLLCTSCKEKGLEVIVYDNEAQEVLNILNSVDDEEKVLSISDIIVGGEDCSQDISEDIAYSVLLKDPKDSTYDMWFKVVFENDTVYTKYDFDKMDEEYAKTLKDMGFTDDYGKCTEMTADEFENLLFD